MENIAYAARLIGPPGLRHWIWLAYMRHNNVTADDNLPRRAYLRGLFMEELARNSELDVDIDSGNVFLLGVLSMIENIAGESPSYLLRDFPPLSSEGNQRDYSLLLSYVTNYEKRDPRIILPDIRASLDRKQIDGKYKMCAEQTDAAILRMDTPT